jgi:hypothetical protein
MLPGIFYRCLLYSTSITDVVPLFGLGLILLTTCIACVWLPIPAGLPGGYIVARSLVYRVVWFVVLLLFSPGFPSLLLRGRTLVPSAATMIPPSLLTLLFSSPFSAAA